MSDDARHWNGMECVCGEGKVDGVYSLDMPFVGEQFVPFDIANVIEMQLEFRSNRVGSERGEVN